jgi:hypothetical protein
MTNELVKRPYSPFKHKCRHIKNTQTQIKFFIKSERCLTSIKRGTSAMHHNHHHTITGIKDDYCIKELICKSAQPKNTITMSQNKTLRNLQEQLKVLKPLELKKSHPNYPINPSANTQTKYLS